MSPLCGRHVADGAFCGASDERLRLGHPVKAKEQLGTPT